MTISPVKVEGFDDLARALSDLPKATARNAMRRAAIEVLQPIAEDYRSNVDELTGELKSTIGVSTRLSPRQASLNRKNESRSYVEAHVGAGQDPAAHLEEFGSVHNAPNPALRNAWDRGWRRALDALAAAIWAEIEKATARARRKAERDAAKMRRG